VSDGAARGLLDGGCLASAGVMVTFVSRPVVHAMRQHGLTLTI
jgi:hypothetical protein